MSNQSNDVLLIVLVFVTILVMTALFLNLDNFLGVYRGYIVDCVVLLLVITLALRTDKDKGGR